MTQTSEKEYQKEVNRLKEDINKYKDLYSKSVNVLEIMEELVEKEKNEQEMKKKKYQEQIQSLKSKIEEKKISLGHVYSYKDWKVEDLIPDTMILERVEESISQISSLGLPSEISRQRAEDLMNYYLDYNKN